MGLPYIDRYNIKNNRKDHKSAEKTVSMATATLPRIAPPSTPIQVIATPSVTRSLDATDRGNRNKSAPATITTSSTYGSHIICKNVPQYGIYPAFITERQTGVKVPPRVNPLAPPPPKRFNTSLETINAHWHNERRRNLMQQREWYRYHGTWSKAFYGSPAEKEAYRRQTRETLKRQMTDLWQMRKQQWKENSKESQQALEYDSTCIMNDINDHRNKQEYLMQYRDDNKTLMEQTWGRRRYLKRVEDQHDEEQLKFNPINWSHTLK